MSQSTLMSYFNQMYDLAQGKKAATLFEEADTTEYPLAEVIKQVLNIEYQPAKNGNNNVANGGADVALRNQVGQGGELRGNEPPASREQPEAGPGQTERGAGTADDSRGAGDAVVYGREADATANPGLGEEVTPKEGPFGEIYTQFKGKHQEAVTYLLAKRSGEAIGALHHKDIGDIDLVWGKEGTAHSDGYGLAKLAKFHPEVLFNLQEVLNDMVVTKRSTNRVQLESDNYQAAVRLTWDDKKKTWLLTMFEKKNSVPDNTTDTVETLSSNGNDTATPENTVISDGKDKQSLTDEQISSSQSSEATKSMTGEESSPQVIDDKSAGLEQTSVQASVQVTDSELESMPMDDLGQLISDAEYAVTEKFDRAIEQVEAEKSALEGKWRRTPAEGRRLKALDKEIAELEQRKKEDMRAASKRYLDVYRKRLRDKADKKSLQDLMIEASAEVDQNPTDAQKEAGNYKKGHITIGDFDITIENPVGSVRSGVDANGKKWETKMANAYGYIKGTESVDGDHIDVFLAEDMDFWDARRVFVIDQTKEDGSFDEHKVMLGFNDKDEAMSAYLANYDATWAEKHPGLRISEVNIEDFKAWIDSSHRKTKPFADYRNIKKDVSASSQGSVADHSTVSKITDNAPKEQQNNDGFTIEVRKDTRDNSDIYAVKFEERVSRDEFKGQKAIAKKHGGYWSNFGKKGFLFKSEADAKAFAAEVMGKSEDDVADQAPLSMADISDNSDRLIDWEESGPEENPFLNVGADKTVEQPKPKKRSKWISDEDAAEFDNLRSGLRSHLGTDAPDIVGEDTPSYGHKKSRSKNRQDLTTRSEELLAPTSTGTAKLAKISENLNVLRENFQSKRHTKKPSVSRTIMDASDVPASLTNYSKMLSSNPLPQNKEGILVVAKLLKGVEKSYNPGIKLLDESEEIARTYLRGDKNRSARRRNAKHFECYRR